MNTRRMMILVALISLSAACGDDAEELTCEMLADPNFCWNARVAEARACTSDQEIDAISTDDGETCVYPGGPVAILDNPIRSESDIDIRLDFSIERDGMQCMSFREDGDDQIVTTPNGTARLGGAGTTLIMECGGTTFEGPGFELLEECGFGELPGQSWSKSSGGFSIGLLPNFEEGFSSVLSCDYEDAVAPL